MSSKKLLVPAVMVSMAAAVVSVDATAASPSSGTTPAIVPAVMSLRGPATYPVPDSLTDYTRRKSAETQISIWAEDPGHCATISGSDNGWDDSDCMR